LTFTLFMNLSCLAFLDALSMVRSNKVSPSFTYYHPNTWRTMDRIVGHLVGSYPSSFVGPFGRPLRIVKLFNRWRRMSAWAGGLNGSTQHSILNGEGVYGHASRVLSRLHSGRELWDRWQGGEALKAIGRAFGKPSSSIYFQLAPHGEFVLRHDAAQGWH
jgi:hypothetical protein